MRHNLDDVYEMPRGAVTHVPTVVMPDGRCGCFCPLCRADNLSPWAALVNVAPEVSDGKCRRGHEYKIERTGDAWSAVFSR